MVRTIRSTKLSWCESELAKSIELSKVDFASEMNFNQFSLLNRFSFSSFSASKAFQLESFKPFQLWTSKVWSLQRRSPTRWHRRWATLLNCQLGGNDIERLTGSLELLTKKCPVFWFVATRLISRFRSKFDNRTDWSNDFRQIEL